MSLTNFSGPAASEGDARAALDRAGYFVLSMGRPFGLEVDDGEALLSCDGQHGDSEAVVAPYGWRLRAIVGTPERAVRIGGQG